MSLVHSRHESGIHIVPAGASLSLHDLIEITKAAADLTTGSRKVIASRLRRFAQIIGLPTEAIAAEITILRDLIRRAQPGASGVSRQYWAAITSSLWAAMDRAGKPTLRRCSDEIPPEWLRLLKPLPAKLHRLTLTPLVRAAIALAIAPDKLDQAACDRIRDHIRSTYSKAVWSSPYRKAIDMVQRCQREYPDLWPQHRIDVVYENDHYALSWRNFPELETEVDAMLAELTQPASRRSTRGIRFRASTAKMRKYAVLRVVSAAVHRMKIGPELIKTLRQVVDPAWVENFVDFVLERGGADDTGNLYQVCRNLTAIARYHVCVDAPVLQELVNIRNSVTRKPGPADKTKKLLLMFRDPAVRHAFVSMPHRVISRLVIKSEVSLADRAVGSRAFAAAFLLRAPFRISELMCLQLGVHIFDMRAQGKRQVRIHIPPEDTKTGRARDLVMSRDLTRHYDIYMRRFRDGGLDSSGLFPGYKNATDSATHIARCWPSSPATRLASA